MTSSTLSTLSDTELLEYTKSITKEIDGTIATIGNYTEYQGLSNDDLRKKMQEIIGNSSLQKDKQLDQLIPLLKKLRVNSLEKIRDSYNRTEEWNISAESALQKDLGALENIPQITSFESAVANAEAAKAKLETAQNLTMDVHDKALHKSLDLQVNMLLDGVFTKYLGDIKSFLEQTHQPTTIPFSNCIESLSANMNKAAADSMAATSVKVGQLKLLDQEVDSAKTELTNKIKEKQEAIDKDKKPFFRKMVRFFTGNRILKPLDVTAFDASIQEARKNTLECEKNKKETDLRLGEVASNKENALQSLKTSLEVAENLKVMFEKSDIAADVSLDNAKKFYAAVNNDPNLVTKFKAERETAAETAASEDAFSKGLGAKFSNKLEAAASVGRGDSKRKDGMFDNIIGGLKNVFDLASVPVVSTAANALLSVAQSANDRKQMDRLKRVDAFKKDPKSMEILTALQKKLTTSYAPLPIEKDSHDDLLTTLSKKVMGAIADESVKITPDLSVNDAVDKFIAYIQKGKFAFQKKTVEVNPENARAGATYTAAGFISKQAIEIKDAEGNKAMLIPESRQEKDEIIGNSKYGSRPATAEEQKDFLANGELKSYAIFIPKTDRLASTLSETLDKIFEGHPKDKEAALVRIESAVAAVKGLKGDKLSAALKTSLSEIIEPGKRSGGVSNTPDETRVNFNIVKNSLIAMIELDATKAKTSPTVSVDPTTTTPPIVSTADANLQMDPNSYKKAQINDALKGVTLVDSTKDAASEIMTIIDTIAARLKDSEKGKSKDFSDDLKASLSQVIKLGNRASFTNKEDPDRKLFNGVKEVVSSMITNKAAEMQKEGKSAQNTVAKSH